MRGLGATLIEHWKDCDEAKLYVEEVLVKEGGKRYMCIPPTSRR
jgi:hypothetical protein